MNIDISEAAGWLTSSGVEGTSAEDGVAADAVVEQDTRTL